uniref:Uncharacterized protein n=1 Tax=Cacopsylla melanoneura TaxID=428564 RepID=A0A8D8U246_9HEMI
MYFLSKFLFYSLVFRNYRSGKISDNFKSSTFHQILFVFQDVSCFQQVILSNNRIELRFPLSIGIALIVFLDAIISSKEPSYQIRQIVVCFKLNHHEFQYENKRVLGVTRSSVVTQVTNQNWT